jgi:hypothetical protein
VWKQLICLFRKWVSETSKHLLLELELSQFELACMQA